MNPASRVTSVSPSPTLAVNAKAGELRAQGIDVISLGVGEPDFPTPAHVCQAAKDAIDAGYTRYTPADGALDLKQAVIAKFKRDNGLDYTPGQVIINVGGKHSGYLVMQALVNPGDEVIIPAPYWVSYPPMVILAGGKPVILPTQEADGFKLKPEDLKAAITDKTKVFVLNSPSNPTGSVYSAEEMKPLVDICVEAGVMIMSDEIYETIVFDGASFASPAGLGPEAYAHTLTLNGVSKAYAMTGWRIGYMAGPEVIIKACAKIQSQSTSNPCSIAQAAAVAALNGPQEAVVEQARIFQERRDFVMQRLAAIPGVECLKPQGAFYAMPNVSAYYGKSWSGGAINGSVDLSGYLLEEAHVATVAGAAFGEDTCIRLSFATSNELLGKALDRIGEALAKLK